MSPLLLLIILILYLSLVLGIGQLTGRRASNETFFLGLFLFRKRNNTD